MAWIERAGRRLWYEVIEHTAPWFGEPQTVVLHHGIGVDSNVWSEWVAALVDRYRVVRFDLSGHGRSPAPPAGTSWSMPGLAEDLLAVADAAGVGRFHLVGESIGGTVGLVAAIRHPARIRTLTVSNGAPRGQVVQNLGDWRDLAGQGGQQRWADVIVERRLFPGQLTPAKHKWLHDRHLACDMETVFGLVELLAASDVTAELGTIACPVLLLSPDSSPFIPAAQMADMRLRIPDCELRVFPHSRHGLPLTHAAECARELRGFLDRHAG